LKKTTADNILHTLYKSDNTGVVEV
jgi:hypothetical protein